MIKSIEKKVSRGRLELTIETKIKDFYSHDNQVLQEEEVYAIASEEHDIKEIISKPDHKVGNYKNLETKQRGVWVFKLVPKRKPKVEKKEEQTLTKTSLRSKINKIAKKLSEDDELEQ